MGYKNNISVEDAISWMTAGAHNYALLLTALWYFILEDVW